MTSLPLRLAGKVVRRAGRVRNRGFTSGLRGDPAAPLLLLSPHADDAVLDCWSVLTAPTPVEVVNAFTGIPPEGGCSYWDSIVGATDSAALMRARLVEDAAALALAGRTPRNLGFLEDPQRAHRPQPTYRELDDAVRAVVPAARRVLVPMALGTVHPDHLLLRSWALALRRAEVPVTLYADVPYATVYGWPHWVTGAERDPHLDVDAYWRPTLTQLPGLAPARVVELAEDQARDKLAAMRRYVTQFPSLDRGPVGQLSNPAVHRFEVFWDVR